MITFTTKDMNKWKDKIMGLDITHAKKKSARLLLEFLDQLRITIDVITHD